MKAGNYESERSFKDINENIEKKTMTGEKEQKEIQGKVNHFFDKFFQKYMNQNVKEFQPDKEKLFLKEIQEMDANTSPDLYITYDINEEDLTEDELKQLDNDDPGYVNGQVIDYNNELKTEKNVYSKTGLHEGAIKWGEYAAKEGVEYKMLQPGDILSRWGNENGKFMSDVNTDYENLQLPYIQEKVARNVYKVIAPFPVEVSKIAIQPWNKNKDYKSTKANENTIQYKMPIPIQKLLEEGYLKKL